MKAFELPPFEAMSCGAPVIAANNSSIPEIVGDAALLFEAQDIQGLPAIMERVLTDETLQTQLRNDD